MRYRNIKLGCIVEPGDPGVEEQICKSNDYIRIDDMGDAAEAESNEKSNDYIRIDDMGDAAETESNEKPMDKMTVAELKALAVRRGIELPTAAKKADILLLLQ